MGAAVILLKAKLTENRPLDIVRDSWRAICKAAYRATGLYWVEKMLPKHFEPGAAERYRYKWRAKGYRLRKDRAFQSGRPIQKGGAPVIAGSDTPNVLTGYMKREVMHNVVVRGFPTRATVIMYGPAYLTTRFFKKNQPDKPAEITAVRSDERQELSRFLRDRVVEGINQVRATRVTE